LPSALRISTYYSDPWIATPINDNRAGIVTVKGGILPVFLGRLSRSRYAVDHQGFPASSAVNPTTSNQIGCNNYCCFPNLGLRQCFRPEPPEIRQHPNGFGRTLLHFAVASLYSACAFALAAL
jgi:hypothetical protein